MRKIIILLCIAIIPLVLRICYVWTKKPRYCFDCGEIIPLGEAIEGPDGEDYCKQCYKVNFCKMEDME